MPRTLLLADNSTAIQRIVALTFAGQDVTVISVGDGDQAIARITAEPPDIVLVDTALPGRNGYEVSAFIKGRPELAHIPALLLAGALERVDVARAAEARCDGVIAKPFEPQQVIARVRELLGGAHGHPEQTLAGVPRPIERLIEPRSMAPAPPVRPDEPSLRIVKHPSAAPSPPPQSSQSPPPVESFESLDEANPSWPEPEGWPETVKPQQEAPRTSAQPAPIAVPPSDFGDDPLGDYFNQLDEAFGGLDAGGGSAGGSTASAGREHRRRNDDERTDLPTLSSVLGDIAPPAKRTMSGAEPPSPPALKHKEEILFGAAPVDPPPIRSVPPPEPREAPIFRAPEPPPPSPPPPRPAPPARVFEPAPEPEPEPAPAPVPESRADAHRSTIADAFEALMAVDEADRQAREAAAQASPPAAAQPAVSPGGISEALVEAVASRVLERLAPDGLDSLISRIVSEVAERLVREEIDRIRGRK